MVISHSLITFIMVTATTHWLVLMATAPRVWYALIWEGKPLYEKKMGWRGERLYRLFGYVLLLEEVSLLFLLDCKTSCGVEISTLGLFCLLSLKCHAMLEVLIWWLLPVVGGDSWLARLQFSVPWSVCFIDPLYWTVFACCSEVAFDAKSSCKPTKHGWMLTVVMHLYCANYFIHCLSDIIRAKD